MEIIYANFREVIISEKGEREGMEWGRDGLYLSRFVH